MRVVVVWWCSSKHKSTLAPLQPIPTTIIKIKSHHIHHRRVAACACVIGDDDDDGHYTPLKVCRYRGYTTHVFGMCVDEGWLINERTTIILTLSLLFVE